MPIESADAHDLAALARRTASQEAKRVYRRALEEGPRVLFCLVGETSGELITAGSRLVVHDNEAELELLISGAAVVAVPTSAGGDPATFVPLAALEDNAALLWPLRPDDFRVAGDGNTQPEPDRLTVNPGG